MKKTTLKFLAVAACVFSLTQAYARTPLPQFESPEHKLAGNKVALQFDLDHSASGGHQLSLPNGLNLTYGEIVALGGDFYGLANAPISLGKTLDERKQRFIQAYATLSQDKNAYIEAPKILSVVIDQETQIEEGVLQGEDPADVYARISLDDEMAWNCITGGLCPADVPWMSKAMFEKVYYLKEGRYLQLLDTDFDHFTKGAWLAYSAGHTVALEKAIEAGKTHDVDQLAEAYAMNAFANHYLSDSFSSGHMRTPHWELYNHVVPPTVGSLLAGVMHREDCDTGLTVSNARGDTWMAYGDGHYLDSRNDSNRALLQEAMQASADQIFVAYTQGQMPAEDITLAYLPDLDKLAADREMHLNTSPLFYWDDKNGALMRRKQLDNPQDYEWTAEWTGWQTLLEISNRQRLTPIEQSVLMAHSDSALESVQKGVVTDKDVLMAFRH